MIWLKYFNYEDDCYCYNEYTEENNTKCDNQINQCYNNNNLQEKLQNKIVVYDFDPLPVSDWKKIKSTMDVFVDKFLQKHTEEVRDQPNYTCENFWDESHHYESATNKEPACPVCGKINNEDVGGANENCCSTNHNKLETARIKSGTEQAVSYQNELENIEFCSKLHPQYSLVNTKNNRSVENSAQTAGGNEAEGSRNEEVQHQEPSKDPGDNCGSKTRLKNKGDEETQCCSKNYQVTSIYTNSIYENQSTSKGNRSESSTKSKSCATEKSTEEKCKRPRKSRRDTFLKKTKSGKTVSELSLAKSLKHCCVDKAISSQHLSKKETYTNTVIATSNVNSTQCTNDLKEVILTNANCFGVDINCDNKRFLQNRVTDYVMTTVCYNNQYRLGDNFELEKYRPMLEELHRASDTVSHKPFESSSTKCSISENFTTSSKIRNRRFKNNSKYLHENGYFTKYLLESKAIGDVENTKQTSSASQQLLATTKVSISESFGRNSKKRRRRIRYKQRHPETYYFLQKIMEAQKIEEICESAMPDQATSSKIFDYKFAKTMFNRLVEVLQKGYKNLQFKPHTCTKENVQKKPSDVSSKSSRSKRIDHVPISALEINGDSVKIKKSYRRSEKCKFLLSIDSNAGLHIVPKNRRRLRQKPPKPGKSNKSQNFIRKLFETYTTTRNDSSSNSNQVVPRDEEEVPSGGAGKNYNKYFCNSTTFQEMLSCYYNNLY